MQRTAADLAWVAQDREARVRGRDIKTVTLGELPSNGGSLVRVAGVLHAFVCSQHDRFVMTFSRHAAERTNAASKVQDIF